LYVEQLATRPANVIAAAATDTDDFVIMCQWDDKQITTLSVTGASTADMVIEALIRERFPTNATAESLESRRSYQHHRLFIGPKVEAQSYGLQQASKQAVALAVDSDTIPVLTVVFCSISTAPL
jgi:hypothetical protein